MPRAALDGCPTAAARVLVPAALAPSSAINNGREGCFATCSDTALTARLICMGTVNQASPDMPRAATARHTGTVPDPA